MPPGILKEHVSEMEYKPVRSTLYMPASNPKAIAKARTLDCDAVILDLEDAVAPDEKADARARALEAVCEGGFGHREVVVRVNGLDTPWGRADLEAIAASPVEPDAVLAPKISTADDVRAYDALLGSLPLRTRLWVMIETARSIFNLPDIADAARDTRLSAFVIGTNDLCKETHARLVAGRAALAPQLCLAVTAAKMAGLTIIDGVYNDLQNPPGLEAECRQALEFGFDGKTLIHPGQIEIANTVFSPTEAEITFATAVIDAFAKPENANVGVLRVEGKMVELLHLEQCRRLMAIARSLVR